MGQLKLAQLNCAEPEADASANHGVDLTPYAGKWVRVQRKGKGYVIEKPCSANNPNFTIKPNGDMTIDYGQEEESFKVTSILPGVTPDSTCRHARFDVSSPAAEGPTGEQRRERQPVRRTGTQLAEAQSRAHPG